MRVYVPCCLPSQPAAAPAPAAVDEDAKAQIEFLFRVADTNDDGKISIRDFQGILRYGFSWNLT